MPKLRHLNLSRNGRLSRVSTVGLIRKMTEKWEEAEQEGMAQQPLAL